MLKKRDKVINYLKNKPLFVDEGAIGKAKEELKILDTLIDSISEKFKRLNPNENFGVKGTESAFANYGAFGGDLSDFIENQVEQGEATETVWGNYSNALDKFIAKRDKLLNYLKNKPIFIDTGPIAKAREELELLDELIDTISGKFKRLNPNENFGVKGTESTWASYGGSQMVKYQEWQETQEKLKGAIGQFQFTKEFGDMGEMFDDLSAKRERLAKRIELAIRFKNVEGAEKAISELESVDTAIKTMFPDDSREIDFGGLKDKVGELRDGIPRLGSDFSRFTRKIGESTRQLGGLRTSLTQLFSIVGTGRVMDDMITASSLRQTNKIMLSARRGTEEANKLYDSIQAMVVELPGNDTFLTNLLTMLGTMDKSLNESDLRYMGGVIADYYMGAQAKGQYNNETERELRNYLMTGQTRNLTNSIIASEIESLKGLNSVKERTIALEKALQKTGMDSIAHYDSYHNTLEEFKGRFQKSFADLGDIFLGFLQYIMKLYNFVDSISGSFLSQITIVFGVVAMGALSATMVIGQLADSIGDLVDMYSRGRNFLFNPKDLDKYSEAIRESILALGLKIGALNADTYAELSNAKAKETNTILTLKESIARWMNMWAVFSETDTVILESIAEDGNKESKIIAKAVIYKETIARWIHSISVMIEEGTLWENTKATIVNAWEKIKSAVAQGWDTAMKWAGVVATNAMTVATYGLAIAGFIADLALSPIGLTILVIVGAIALLVVGVEKLGESFGWWTDFGSMFEAISAGINRVWQAFWNNEHIQEAIYIIQGFIYNLQGLFSSVRGGLMELIFGTPGSAGDWDIVEDIINVLGGIGEALWWLSSMDEILEVLRAVGALIGWISRQWNAFVQTPEFQTLIDDFREIRVLIGEVWKDIGTTFEEVGEIWAELWGDDKKSKLGEDGNELLEYWKALASFIHNYIIPILKVVIPGLIYGIIGPVVLLAKFIIFVRDVLNTIGGVLNTIGGIFSSVFTAIYSRVKIVVDFINRFIEGVRWIVDKFGWLFQQNDKKPTNIANQEGGYNMIMEDKYKYDYSKAKDLSKSYINNNNGHSTIINNNFSEGSVQADARNMTKKDVQKMFTSAFGYNRARGVKGVIR